MNNQGFIWVETLVSLNVILLVMTTIIPIYTTIQKEKQVIKEGSLIEMQLFNELHIVLNDSPIPEESFTKQVENREVTYQFFTKEEYIKGCATWKNAKGKSEERCLYGIRNK